METLFQCLIGVGMGSKAVNVLTKEMTLELCNLLGRERCRMILGG